MASSLERSLRAHADWLARLKCVSGLADHTVTLYSAKQDLFAALAAAASLQGEAPHDVLLLELIVDASGGQTLAWLNGLARELGLRIIVLTTAAETPSP